MKFRGDVPMLLAGLWVLLEKTGHTPSMRDISKVARFMGVHIDDKIVRRMIHDRNSVLKAPHRSATARAPQSHRTFASSAPQSHPTITAAAPHDEVLDLGLALPVVAPPKKPKAASQVLVTPDLPEDVDFGDLEPDVKIYVANAAAQNKTGKIAESRVLTLRRELFAVLTKVDHRDAFAYGLRVANSKNAPNPNYVKSAALNHKANPEPVYIPPPKPAPYRQGSVLPQ
jgi:hypothetical protein